MLFAFAHLHIVEREWACSSPCNAKAWHIQHNTSQSASHGLFTQSTPFMFKHQAVLLVSGSSDHLLPLNTTGLPAALLPVANQPLITFPLHLLDAGSVRDVLLVRPRSYCRLSCSPLPLHVLHLHSANSSAAFAT